MAEHVESGHCPTCDAQRKITAPAANHVLHLLMTVLTGALWLPIWVGSSMSRTWRCDECGTPIDLGGSGVANVLVVAVVTVFALGIWFVSCGLLVLA